MSTEGKAEGLTDRDREVLDHIGGEVPDDHDAQEQIEALRKENRELAAEVQDLRDELTATKKTLFSELNKVRDELNGQDPTDPRSSPRYADLTTLEKYARMSEEERDDLLGSSDQRAVLIFENWSDWSRTVDAGELINTNHTRGKHGKTAISVDLQTATGEDLQANEVYRAMKAVAKLSASDPDDIEHLTDTNGREHVTGGAFEYHEKVNPDANGQKRKFKILKLADADAITFP